MEEAKVIQAKGDQTNFSFQEKQPPLPFFPSFLVEKQTSKQTHVPNPEPDLNLRLSLGEAYDTKQNPLTKSSSIAVNSEKKFMEHLENTFPKTTYLSLARSSSLPVEMKRGKRAVNMKELRVLRRVEAKKRAEQKHRNAMKGTDVPYFPTENPANKAIGKMKESSEGGEGSEIPNPGPEINASEATAESENPTKKAKVSNGGWLQENGLLTVLARTFTVTTTGDGPNGRKINGFLHGYENGKVTLECGCHGHLLSPEEFVKHAGGNVTDAMKQVYIFPNSFYY